MAKFISPEMLNELKADALNYESFLADAEPEHKQKYDESYALYSLTEEHIANFTSLSSVFDVLVLTAFNCGDSMTNLPLLAKLAAETNKLSLHILLRDEFAHIHQHYLHKDGKPHIPTYIFFDETGKELGVFIERPDAVSKLSDEWANTFWDMHPELDGRGLPISELDAETKLALVTQLRRLRPTVAELEQEEIIKIILNYLK